ncbi:MAG: alanine--tRNA ligase [Alphaproteobacteria bacterium]|nr:alanine--tRNA ligase [Alphaproteobacteria bacterium]
MMQVTAKKIRSTFLDFFEGKAHKRIQSSSLIPHNDPTMMFVNSGMVQFKNVFTGFETRDYKRATSCQKSVRAGGKHNDLENVGYTARHHTFFEMLGNFSFGDYFKEEAIYFAWELLTKEFLIPKEKLYVTIYHTDSEAELFWKKIANLGSDRIIKISTNDNFWSMGETGPCGPCSEIFYDHGEHIPGGLPGASDQDGDRFIEIWNMVFMEYEQKDKDTRINLPQKSIDTGMGLERIAAVLQNVHDNYDIDIFQDLIRRSEDLIKVKAEGRSLFSYRIIADHLRSSSFLIADGVMPSNEGRGYVLRRIMRRAMRHARSLGASEPVMHNIVPTLVELMHEAYPELRRSESFIKEVIKSEEEKFIVALDRGMKILDEASGLIKKGDSLGGDIAFKLYDTYGFPLDLTQDILKERDITIDVSAFEKSMQEQKERARKSWGGSGESKFDKIWFDIKEKYGSTEFLGYSHESLEGQVIALIRDGEELNEAKAHENFILVTNQTPFYGESGGQMGDIGYISAENSSRENLEIEVLDTKKYLGSIIGHHCKVKKGVIKLGEVVSLAINQEYRAKLKKYHSATHLLHKALREILGEHITQKGSQVASDKLRFDISHMKPINKDELALIEKRVNQMILANGIVTTKLMNVEEAINSGAIALFGEKYDDEVRVVSMPTGGSDNIFATELCGGTHVGALGEIGLFKITAESAISSGVRRIEGVCGMDALKLCSELQSQVDSLSSFLKVGRDEIFTKVVDIAEAKKNLENNLAHAKEREFSVSIEEIEQNAISAGEVLWYYKIVEMADAKTQRIIASKITSHFPNLIFISISSLNDKISTVVSSGKMVCEQIPASEVIKLLSTILSTGGGGGSKELAQSGGACLIHANEIGKKMEEFLASRVST